MEDTCPFYTVRYFVASTFIRNQWYDKYGLKFVLHSKYIGNISDTLLKKKEQLQQLKDLQKEIIPSVSKEDSDWYKGCKCIFDIVHANHYLIQYFETMHDLLTPGHSEQEIHTLKNELSELSNPYMAYEHAMIACYDSYKNNAPAKV